MAGYTESTVVLTTGGELYAAITNAFTPFGWSGPSGYTWTKTFDGRTMTVDLTGLASITAPTPYIHVNNRIGYFPVASSYAGVTLAYVLSISNDHFFLQLRGPNAGAAGAFDASYGSAWAYAMITSIEPASPTDTVKDDLQVSIVSHPNTAQSQQWATANQKKNTAGTSNAACEFIVDRPAVQDIASVGDLPPSIQAGAGYFGSRYKVIDSILGFRGQLNNVAFASESYTQTGDSGAQQFVPGTEYVRKGVKYIVLNAAGNYNASGIIQASPLGTSHQNPMSTNSSGAVSGPRIFLKKGDGA
jgi:hypothetical protein